MKNKDRVESRFYDSPPHVLFPMAIPELRDYFKDWFREVLVEQANNTVLSVQDAEKPMKIKELSEVLDLSKASIYALQRRGIIKPHRFTGSSATYYYLSEAKQALQEQSNVRHATRRQQKSLTTR